MLIDERMLLTQAANESDFVTVSVSCLRQRSDEMKGASAGSQNRHEIHFKMVPRGRLTGSTMFQSVLKKYGDVSRLVTTYQYIHKCLFWSEFD